MNVIVNGEVRRKNYIKVNLQTLNKRLNQNKKTGGDQPPVCNFIECSHGCANLKGFKEEDTCYFSRSLLFVTSIQVNPQEGGNVQAAGINDSGLKGDARFLAAANSNRLLWH